MTDLERMLINFLDDFRAYIAAVSSGDVHEAVEHLEIMRRYEQRCRAKLAELGESHG